LGVLGFRERLTVAVAVVAGVLAGILTAVHAGAVLTFAVSAVSLAALAALVGQATEQVGGWLGPGATGVLQSALGNVPELFVGIFSLQKGYIPVVQAMLVGSVLGNSLLVLGLAFLVGGLRHGTQYFASEPPRMIVSLTVLAVAALAVPTLAHGLHAPSGAHADILSLASAVVLLAVFAASIPFSLTGGPSRVPSPEVSKAGSVRGRGGEEETAAQDTRWPLWLAALILAAAGVGAAIVSDWFVGALNPAITALHISQRFTGLVIVAIAGNAVENVVGVQLAARNRPDYAISVILNSSLQVALGLTPVLVLLSFVIGGAHLTLVLPGLLVAALGLAAALDAFIVYDGESTWLEGAALVGLYGIIAASFWWG
jgi:Ca2+:H+ antiporter